MTSGDAFADRRSGFSLLEVVLALAILAAGLTTIFALFAAGTANQKRAIDFIHASTIAEQVMMATEVRLRRGEAPLAILEDPPTGDALRDYPGYGVKLDLLEIDTKGGADCLLLRVDVYWKQRGAEKFERFEQFITDRYIVDGATGGS